MSMKNSNDTSGNRTSDLPICTLTTAPPQPPWFLGWTIKLKLMTVMP